MFDDAKGVIRNRTSKKDRQRNHQTKKDRRTHTTIHKTLQRKLKIEQDLSH
jgi:hypothetical protein